MPSGLGVESGRAARAGRGDLPSARTRQAREGRGGLSAGRGGLSAPASARRRVPRAVSAMWCAVGESECRPRRAKRVVLVERILARALRLGARASRSAVASEWSRAGERATAPRGHARARSVGGRAEKRASSSREGLGRRRGREPRRARARCVDAARAARGGRARAGGKKKDAVRSRERERELGARRAERRKTDRGMIARALGGGR